MYPRPQRGGKTSKKKPSGFDGCSENIWALGLLLCQVFSRQNEEELTVHRGGFEKVMKGVQKYCDDDVAPAIKLMLNEDPNERPTASELLKKLKRCPTDLQQSTDFSSFSSNNPDSSSASLEEEMSPHGIVQGSTQQAEDTPSDKVQVIDQHSEALRVLSKNFAALSKAVVYIRNELEEEKLKRKELEKNISKAHEVIQSFSATQQERPNQRLPEPKSWRETQRKRRRGGTRATTNTDAEHVPTKISLVKRLTNEKLRKILACKGLDTTGLKANLVSRVVDAYGLKDP
mmetsp:Transcript_12598/g.16665  ORF Transcript_12598/g.16665 Transcript_12598/m.16665 type:complete len:288 (-) Transcript_12598:336-1199(-)